MKNRAVFVILIIIAALIPVTPAFSTETCLFFPVSGMDSASPVSEFDYGKTPFLYVNLDGELPAEGFDLFNTTISTEWKFNGVLKDTVDREGLNQVEFRFASPNWTSIRQPGLWNVYGTFTIEDLVSHQILNCASSTSFTVNAVPEPVSTILFISGGSILAVKRLFRRRS